jgi:hypothetical protein
VVEAEVVEVYELKRCDEYGDAGGGGSCEGAEEEEKEEEVLVAAAEVR